MGHRGNTVAFGVVAVIGLVLIAVAILGPFEPVATEGNETGRAYIAPLRQIGGVLVLAGIVGWLATRFNATG